MKREELLTMVMTKINNCQAQFNDIGVSYWTEAYNLIDEYTKPKKKTKSLEEKAQMLIIDQNKVQLFIGWLKYRKNLKKTIKVQETLDRLAIKFARMCVFIPIAQ